MQVATPTSSAAPAARRGRLRRHLPHLLAVSIAATAFGVGGGAGPASAVADDDWLGIVNTYRAMSGLAPVTANSTWSGEARAHSCYMLLNDISHDEVPGKPGYTAGGDTAGNNSNVAVSSAVSATPRNHIDLWMTGPFHAIGILRHNLRTSAFGLCASADTPSGWHSAGTLDVLRGLDATPRPSSPIVFPGNGATVPLHSFVAESPNPVDMCGWSMPAGLPLIAMMPSDVTSATASLTGPGGEIDTCVLHERAAKVDNSTAKAILDADNAVVVVPRSPLVDGVHTATIDTNGGSITWSFTVRRGAPLVASKPPAAPKPTRTAPTGDPARFEPVTPFRFVDSRIGLGAQRLRGGTVSRIAVTDDPDVVAVSANFVGTEPKGPGYLSTFSCSAGKPEVSTLGYVPGTAVANQAFVPLTDGDMCVYSLVDSDVVIDINGYYRTDDGVGFVPTKPVRLLDTRSTGKRPLAPGRDLTLAVVGTTPGAPVGATAVAVNLTAIDPGGPGFIRAFPCGSTAASTISSINFTRGEVRANTVVVPVSSSGTICLSSNVTVDVAIDLAGHFRDGAGYEFQPLAPVRMLDTRYEQSELNPFSHGLPLKAGQVVALEVSGRQGVPADATAASINITTVAAGAASYVTAYPCGARPTASNVNIAPSQLATSNGAMVKLSSGGEICLYAVQPVHVIVDINGVWI